MVSDPESIRQQIDARKAEIKQLEAAYRFAISIDNANKSRMRRIVVDAQSQVLCGQAGGRND